MGHKKDIGTLLKNKLQNEKVSPEKDLWEGIEEALERKKRKRAYFLWLFSGVSVVAFLLLVFLLPIEHNPFRENNAQPKKETNPETLAPQEKTTIVDGTTDTTNQLETTTKKANTTSDAQKTTKTTRTVQNSANSNIENQTNSTNKTTEQTKTSKQSDGSSTKNKPAESPENKETAYTGIAINNKGPERKVNTPNSRDTNAEDNRQLEGSNEKEKEKEKQEKEATSNSEAKEEKLAEEKSTTQKPDRKIWGVSLIGGPVSYSHTQHGSKIDRRLSNNATKGRISATYGAALSFYFTDKMSLRYGVQQTTLQYTTNNIPTVEESDIMRILSFSALRENSNATYQTISEFLQEDTETKLLQEITYTELPLEFELLITNKKFGAQAAIGMSTYLLSNNALYVENSDSNLLKIGEADNLSKVTFSVNVSVGTYYKFSDRFIFSVNPSFRYQFNTLSKKSYSSTTNYILGVHGNLTYKFNM